LTERGQYRVQILGYVVLATLVMSLAAAMLIANMFVPFG
jgi:hypothetical protein